MSYHNVLKSHDYLFSMGGHGALTLLLKNPTLYSSSSCFGGICNPMECQWGQKAFTGYLGTNKETWKVKLLKNKK